MPSSLPPSSLTHRRHNARSADRTGGISHGAERASERARNAFVSRLFSDESPSPPSSRSTAKIVLRFRNVGLWDSAFRLDCQLAGRPGRRRRVRSRRLRELHKITHSSSPPFFSPRNSTQSLMLFLSRIPPDNVRELAPPWERTTTGMH